ncbi:uncharacterized protein LOC121873537 isoform X3 [Homarus americanus]|uniref:uncharacterized protein LOC121873537 isoform X3 n=1 Tax=Homarus americanus TaxID=6706 RepID=UPI001C48B8DD|nr:uncharacterized protein LOC121873537 isoform X3 [Homarus americanus]
MKPVYVRPESGDSVKRATCYVCGCPRYAEYPLAVRQQATGPYFPFLETHEPPDGSEPPSPDGRVLSCFLCYSYLTQQWQLYERDKVPPVKRIYWLKRVDNGPYTGVEVGVQSEYASQLLGLAPDPPPPTDIKRPGPSGSTRAQPSPAASAAPPAASIEVKRSRIVPPQPQPPSLPLPPPGVPPLPHGLTIPQVGPQQEALDLSLDGRRGTKREREEDVAYRDPRPPAVTPPRTEVLDLRMPDKNATTEVCYVCGDHHKKGTLVDIYAKQQSGSCPFFPSLMLHPRPSKSHPMEASGRVQGCRDCYRHLQLQWDAYEVHNIPHGDRNYSLRKRSSSLLQDCTAFVCYKCGRECPSSSLCLIYCKPNSENEPYYPFIQKLDPPEGASPISPQGMVQVCSVCYKTIPQEQRDLQKKRGDNGSNKSPRGSVTDGSGGGEEQRDSASPQHPPALTPPTHQVLPRAASTAAADGDPHMEEATCYLCHQNHARQAMHWLAMVAEGTFQDGMYFSFLKYLPRIGQNSVVENGRVLACSPCFHHLSTQWNEYEKDKIPKEHRQFSLRAMPTNSHSPRLTPGPTHSSPGTSPSDSSPPHGFSAAIEAHLKSSEIVKKAPPGYAGQPLHTLEVVPAEQDSKAPTLPVITTQNALNIAINCFVCSFHSKAGQTYALRSKPHGSEPFFPFLEKHQSAHPEARVNDSCVLACLCCFHSLILQWQRYEKEQVAHYARLYDTYNYSCFICSLKTYRKRLYLLPVKDYPFLKDHNRPSGGMVVDNGHSVVVCKDCYSSLKNQYIELERWGVPVEKRQYNWIQRPPPPDFQQGTTTKPSQGPTMGSQPPLVEPGSSSPGFHPGTPPGVLSQPGGGDSPRGSQGPVLGSSTAAVDGSGSRSGVVNLCEDPPSPASSALPKLIESVSIPVESTETSCVGSIPSCHAPLQLKIGVARQGGTQHNTLTKQHSVAPSEGLNSGDAKQPRHARQKLIPVDQSSKRLNTENLHAANLSKEHISSSQATTHNQLNNEDKVAHKKRKSVIRGLSSKAVPTGSTSTQSQLSSCSRQLLTPPHELQAKCS